VRRARRVRKVLPARTELTAYKVPPVLRVPLVTTARLDLRVLLARSVRRVLLVTTERLGRKDLKVPLARMELTERRDLLALRVT
jgi:hypothetical protein